MDAFSDPSLADCENSKKTCGYLIRMYGNTVAWRMQKQGYVSSSTCQAEYIALSETCVELIALTNSLENVVNTIAYPITVPYNSNAITTRQSQAFK